MARCEVSDVPETKCFLFKETLPIFITWMPNTPTHLIMATPFTNRPLGYKKCIIMPLCKVADTPFHIQNINMRASAFKNNEQTRRQ